MEKERKSRVPLPLLDNYAYAEWHPPVASAYASELAERMVEIIEHLDYGDSRVLADQLASLAKATKYPLRSPVEAKGKYDWRWITEDDYELTDWLLEATMDHGYNRVKIACIVASLYWCLTREEMDLSPYLKSLGINQSYANFSTQDYLKIFEKNYKK